MAALRTWRPLKGENRLPMVVAATAAPDHRAA